MDYDHIEHDTRAVDDIMRTANERARMAAKGNLNRTRAGLLLSGVLMAAIAGLALVGAAASAAWIMRPHFDFHTVNIDVPRLHEKEIEVPKLVEREVVIPIPKLVWQEVDIPIPKLIEREVDIPIPKLVAPPLPPKTPDRAERKFRDQPDYQRASVKGRVIKSYDNRLHFDNGSVFWPAQMRPDGKAVRDPSGHAVEDPSLKIESDEFIGDYGYCNYNASETDLVDCYVIHNDVVRKVPTRPISPSSSNSLQPSGTPPATDTISVDVDVDGYPVKAMVDTGCTWPMVIPKVLADALVSRGLAAHTSPGKSSLADGTVKDTDVVVINQIAIGGHVLQVVVAAVIDDNSAPILLGLGALNRLRPYVIGDGKITFYSDQRDKT
jgi:hypothetical protein